MTRSPISVLILARNSSRFVKQTVFSVLGQSLDDFELLILDNGSADGTREVVEGIADPRIRLLRATREASPADLWAAATTASRGDLLAFLGDCDLMDPHRLELEVDFLDGQPDGAAAVHTDALVVDGWGRAVGPWRVRPSWSAPGDVPTLIGETVLADRSVFDGLAAAEWGPGLLRRAAEARPFHHLALQLTKYRQTDRPGGTLTEWPTATAE